MRILKKIRNAGIFPMTLRAAGLAGIKSLNFGERLRASVWPTYQTNLQVDASQFPRYFNLPQSERIPLSDHKAIQALSDRFLNHEFDLLGSGWIKICRNLNPKGVEGVRFNTADVAGDAPPVNRANQKESFWIWRQVPESSYEPIHWHVAYRSGYQWPADIWRTVARKNLPRGVDIKEPWELSRMQHLVVLATGLAWAAGDSSKDVAERIAREIQAQILDFIANNPPSYGVNWACTMDVALRACSWLITYDLCRDAGIKFDDEFLKIFGRSIYEHARFIARHLEWSDLTRGNHYLIDIIGLIFCCAYLPPTKITDSWLHFSAKEFHRELARQFNPDGTNIECSTAYHCFVSEAVTYATSLLIAILRKRKIKAFNVRTEGIIGFFAKRAGIALSTGGTEQRINEFTAEGISERLVTQLNRMKEFIEDITRPDGSILNIGDNDSGFFVKLGNRYHVTDAAKETCPELQDLSRRYIADLINDFLCGETSVWVSDILPVKMKCSGFKEISEKQTQADVIPFRGREKKQFHQKIVFSESADISGLQFYAYCDFGLYILKNKSLFVSVRTHPGAGQVLCHKHDDHLSVTISVGRYNLIDDPGIPFYTPFPEIASMYRSTAVHFSPKGIEDDELADMSVFWRTQRIVITGRSRLLLSINVVSDGVEIISDYPLPELKAGRFQAVAISSGYGKKSGM